MNQEDEDEIETRYKIDSAQGQYSWAIVIPVISTADLLSAPCPILVFNKLILTALKFTPVVLNKHMPTKEMASGK